MSMTKYVLGFLFSEDKQRIALIQKNRPSWQKGLLNGIGGHIEDGETEMEAMAREFKEEAGVEVLGWKKFAILLGDSFEVTCFKAFSDKIYKITSITDEQVEHYYGDDIDLLNTVSNVQWLAKMCLDSDNFVAKVEYQW